MKIGKSWIKISQYDKNGSHWTLVLFWTLTIITFPVIIGFGFFAPIPQNLNQIENIAKIKLIEELSLNPAFDFCKSEIISTKTILIQELYETRFKYWPFDLEYQKCVEIQLKKAYKIEINSLIKESLNNYYGINCDLNENKICDEAKKEAIEVGKKIVDKIERNRP